MSLFDPAAYGPVFSRLLAIDRNRALDGGSPEPHAARELKKATLDAAFAHAPVVDVDIARCCLAAVFLLHDLLDESHAISQELDDPSGSFWHGVMHRREGDFSNAKYWFRRVGNHAALAQLGEDVRELVSGVNDASVLQLAERLTASERFDPHAFVDACQAALRTGDFDEQFCRSVQQAEWEALFDFCYRGAIGA